MTKSDLDQCIRNVLHKPRTKPLIKKGFFLARSNCFQHDYTELSIDEPMVDTEIVGEMSPDLQAIAFGRVVTGRDTGDAGLGQ